MANRFWVGGGASGNVNATGPTNWSATDGGAGNASVPSSADDVFFTSLSGSGTATLSATTTWKSADWNGYTGTFAFGTSTLNIGNGVNNSSVRYGAATIFTFGSSNQLAFASPKSYTITTNGNTSGPGLLFGGCTITFKDDFSANDDLFGNTGTIDASDGGANHNVTAKTFSFVNTPFTWTMGNGTWLMTGNSLSVNAGATVTPGSSTFKITGNVPTFAGGGHIYNNFWYATAGAGPLTITGANTFNDFRDDGGSAHTITLPASATQTVTTFSVNGTVGNLISLRSSSAGTAATLSKSSGTVSADYLDIKDSNAAGGATWNAGANCVNSGNNSGWNFAAGDVLMAQGML